MARATGTRDYRDGTLKDPEGKSAPVKRRDERMDDQASRRWWEQSASACSEAVATSVRFLQERQAPRIRNMVMNARMYGNLGSLTVGSSAFGTMLQTQTSGSKKFASYNAAGAGLDTLVSHIGETKPQPYYLTSGGNYKQHRQAKMLTQFNDGVFYEEKTYRKGPLVFRDAGVWGDGFINVFVRGGKIRHERVLAAELWVDEVEAQYGSPRNMHRIKVVDRDELAGYFPEHAKTIMNATRSKETQAGGAGGNLSDMVTVVESWHLGAMDEDGKMVGGKHAICLMGASGGTSAMLVEPEDWEYDFFPFARIPWCPALVGYWSQGAVEQVRGKQLWLNELYWTVQKAMRLSGTIKVAMEHGSKLVDEHINNEIGAVLKHAPGKPPVFFTAAPVDGSFFEEIRSTKEAIFEQIGVSQLSASNLKPAGLDSKPALREYKDSQSQRHQTVQASYDQFFLDISHMNRCLARELKNYRVRVPGASGFRAIDLKQIGPFKDEEFILQCFPISQLARLDPAGRTQTVQEWVQAGWYTPRQGRKLMQFQDLQAENTLADAQEELITSTLDSIVDGEGDYRPPEPTDDLGLAKETVLHYIQLYRRLELEPEKLDQLRTYSQQVDMLLKKTLAPLAAAPGAVPGAPAGVPQGQPQPAPQSELLPQAA